MKKQFLSVLLAMALVFSVTSPGSAQQASDSLSPERAGELAGLFVELRNSWDNMSDFDSAEESDFSFAENKLVVMLAAYFRANVQRPGSDPQKAKNAAKMLLGYAELGAADRNALRGKIYAELDHAWPRSRYRNWDSFYRAFIGAVDGGTETRPLAAGEVGRLLGLYARTYRLWYPNSQRNQMHGIYAPLRPAVRDYLIDHVVGATLRGTRGWKVYNTVTNILHGDPRGRMYSELDSPWPEDRYNNWDEFYNAFVRAAGS